MRHPFDVAIRWRVRRELRTLLPLEIAALEARIAALELELERTRLELDREVNLLRRATSQLD
jgi:uncharacterized small protein (DUF1192 family)